MLEVNSLKKHGHVIQNVPFVCLFFFPSKDWISQLKLLLPSLPACSHTQKFLHELRTEVFTVQ